MKYWDDEQREERKEKDKENYVKVNEVARKDNDVNERKNRN